MAHIHWICLMSHIISIAESRFLSLQIPSYELSYCTYRMNFSNHFGCNSMLQGNVGIVLVVRSVKELQYKLSLHHDEKLMIVVPASVIAQRTVIRHLNIKAEIIAGIIVFEPSYCLLNSKRICPNLVIDLPEFSEVDPCRDPFYRHFNKKACYFSNIFGHTNLHENRFPFPLVFIKSEGRNQHNIVDCYERYNVFVSRSSKCKIIIKSFTPRPKPVSRCLENTNLFRYKLSMSSHFHYCSEISGHNIYITFNPSKFYKKKSVLLFITKLDSKSMFDTASAGTRELYEPISILMYMSLLFNKTIFENNTDILVAFLDNQQGDSLGSFRIIYDLKTKQVSNGIGNISDENIKLIISIDDVSTHSIQNVHLFLYQCQRSKDDVCRAFVDTLKVQIAVFRLKLIVYVMEDEADILLRTLDVPKISIRTSVASNAKYRQSFLDRMQPFTLSNGHFLAYPLAMTSVLLLNSSPFDWQTAESVFRAYEMSYCFYNISCEKLKMIIGPREHAFLKKFGSPPVAQSFVNGFVESKKGVNINSLSYFVMKLMVYYLQKSSEIDPNCLDMEKLNNFTLTIFDIKRCIHANIQVRTDFNPLNYMKSKIELFEKINNIPILMRSNVVTEQRFILFVSVDYEVYTTVLVIATLITAVCFVVSIFAYRSIDSIFPEEIF